MSFTRCTRLACHEFCHAKLSKPWVIIKLNCLSLFINFILFSHTIIILWLLSCCCHIVSIVIFISTDNSHIGSINHSPVVTIDQILNWQSPPWLLFCLRGWLRPLTNQIRLQIWELVIVSTGQTFVLSRRCAIQWTIERAVPTLYLIDVAVSLIGSYRPTFVTGTMTERIFWDPPAHYRVFSLARTQLATPMFRIIVISQASICSN